MTIFLKIKEHFPVRALEWFCSFLILLLGWTMLIAPDSFDRPAMQSFSELMPGIVWALSLMVLGFFRLGALAVNGSNFKITLPIRWLGSILGAGLFGLFVGRFSLAMDDSSVLFAIVTYSSLVIAEIYNTLRTAQEAKHRFLEV